MLGCNAPGVRTGSQGRHFRRPASEPPSPRHRADPPLPSCVRPSGRPRVDLHCPAVARCCEPGAKAPHATPPPCPRPPGLGAPPAIAWDLACDPWLWALSSLAGVMFTPARLALDSPMAITCLAERAPCLPSRTCSISSRTYSPACVEGDLVFRAGRAVFFSGTPTVRRRAAFSLPGLPNMERRRSTGTPPIPRWYRPYRAICFCQNQEPSPVLSCPRPG